MSSALRPSEGALRPGGASATSLSQSARRIQRELGEMTSEPPPLCAAGPCGDNLYEWVAAISGPPGQTQLSWLPRGFLFLSSLLPAPCSQGRTDESHVFR